MVFTWYRELGLAIEKHSTTTSDLRGGQRTDSQALLEHLFVGLTLDLSISPAVCKTSVLVMVPKSVPEAEGHTDVIHHISGTFQYLKIHQRFQEYSTWNLYNRFKSSKTNISSVTELTSWHTLYWSMAQTVGT